MRTNKAKQTGTMINHVVKLKTSSQITPKGMDNPRETDHTAPIYFVLDFLNHPVTRTDGIIKILERAPAEKIKSPT